MMRLKNGKRGRGKGQGRERERERGGGRGLENEIGYQIIKNWTRIKEWKIKKIKTKKMK